MTITLRWPGKRVGLFIRLTLDIRRVYVSRRGNPVAAVRADHPEMHRRTLDALVSGSSPLTPGLSGAATPARSRCEQCGLEYEGTTHLRGLCEKCTDRMEDAREELAALREANPGGRYRT